MVIKKRTYLFWVFLWCTFLLQAQRHLRTEVSFNKGSVYVGEPIEVSVTVYSSTWFTEGVDPGNIKINGAYTVYFRSLSTSKKFGNKLYAGVTLFFNVFPYNEENVEFPSLEFVVETPDEGNYVGVKRKVKTRAREIVVKPIPPGMDKNAWLVSSSMRVYDSWKGDLTKVKVGDVLERNITMKVGGTISEFIPQIQFDSIQGISLYPKRSYLKNNKTKTAISAQRTDGTRYLFEKEGVYIIPEITVYWWNPRYSKLYKRVLKETKIEVAPNPDLGMLESVRKSLEATVEKESEEEKELLIFGFSLKQFLAIILVSIVTLFFGFKILRKAIKAVKAKKAAYEKSEAFFFNRFLKEKIYKNQQTEIYKWLGQLSLKEPSIEYFITIYGTKKLKEVFEINKSEENDFSKILALKLEWKKARKNFINSKKENSTTNSNWVNP